MPLARFRGKEDGIFSAPLGQSFPQSFIGHRFLAHKYTEAEADWQIN